MFSQIIKTLENSTGYVSLNSICMSLRNDCPNLTSSNLKETVSNHLERGYKMGLIYRSADGFKLSVNLNKPENEYFESTLKRLNHEYRTSSPERVTTAVSSYQQEAPKSYVVDRRTPTLNSLWNKRPADCGPGWNRRPLAQRQAIAIRRRQAAQEKIRQRIRAARQRRARSRSRSRSPSRSRSRSRSPRRSRSRSRSRSARARG
ncbi:arginine/serine-rich coiled-coil protein 2-like [Armigeres subalbatus]|uniref:arginine/serine-rich coiled-coil protein 2-like n=1 Tax=Armigeres subalbatus TaxID=124917 RepID=UPI002ED1F214